MRHTIFLSIALVFAGCEHAQDEIGFAEKSVDDAPIPEQEETQDTKNVPVTGNALLAELAKYDDSDFNPIDRENIISRIILDHSISMDAKNEHFLRYAEKHRKARPSLLEGATADRSPKLGPWLLKHGRLLNERDWNSITSTLSLQGVRRNTWQDSAVIGAFVKYCLPSNDEGIYGEGVAGIAFAGRVDEVIALLPRLSIDIDKTRLFIYDAQARFDHPKANAAIRKAIGDYKEPQIVERLIEHDFVRNNRYDFIPDLKQLRARLTKITDVTQKGQALAIIDAIDKAIPQLERIKDSGVPVGEHLKGPEPER